MKINFESLNATMTKEQIDQICDKVETHLNKEHSMKWHNIILESIKEKAHSAGRDETNKTNDDVGNGYAEVLPQITKEYTKLFVKQALIEIFCDDE